MPDNREIDGGDKHISVSGQLLSQELRRVCLKYAPRQHAEAIVEKISEAEKLGVATHGLHYFLGAVLPLLQQGLVHDSHITVSGNFIHADCQGGVGFYNVLKGLQAAGRVAAKTGVAVITFKMPGKVGALRTYCREFTSAGQFIVLLKNTAPMLGLPETGGSFLGTNPLAVGLAGTDFIFDGSLSSVSTNTVRIKNKLNETFSWHPGFDRALRSTASPQAILDEGGGLLPFSCGPSWYKSFFLAVVVEALSALAGGRTGKRVKDARGRLYSKEGMAGMIVDKNAFPQYEHYLDEVQLLFNEILACGLTLPGSDKMTTDEISVIENDWEALGKL